MISTVNPRKATGVHGVPWRVLKACADQLAHCLHKHFQSVTVPKRSTITPLNNFLPVALTPAISWYQYQFVYQTKRTTEDTIATILHSVLSHLEKWWSYIRKFFLDYSSAFITIVRDILIPKLANLGLPQPTCSWIKDFLVNQPQQVKLGPHVSSVGTLSTGSLRAVC